MEDFVNHNDGNGSQPSLLPRIRNLQRRGPGNNEDRHIDWNTEFAILKSSLSSAMDEGDNPALASAVQDWKELLEAAPDYIYQELILINPLAAAVQRRRRQIVEFFVKECGMRLEAFHECGCDCRLCVVLRVDIHFLELYTDFNLRALTSPLYIFCVHPESVIDVSLSLIKNMNIYKACLTADCRQSIKRNLESAMILSLGTASNHREVRHLLSDSSCLMEMERVLGRAMQFADRGFKQVLAHSASQSLLREEWFGNDAKTNRWLRRIDRSYVTLILHSLFSYFFLLPLTIFLPASRLVRYINTPYVKFQTEFASFWIFLIFAIVTMQYTYLNILMVCQGSDKSPAMLKLVIVQGIFAGLLILKIFRFVTLIYFNGRRIFVSGYDRLQFLSVLCYSIACILININVHIIPRKTSIINYCNQILRIPNVTYVGEDCGRTKSIYNSNVFLPSWIAEIMQPYMIGSVFFSVGHLMYFISSGQGLYMIRELVIFTIAVQKMVVDCIKWGVFFILFLLAWSVAMMVLYSGYRCGTSYFNGLQAATQEIFWVVFAMTGTTDYQLSVNDVSSIWSQSLVQYMGLLMYTSFFMIGTLILVNLLIALMAVTYENINESANVEIAYWQSKVRIKYILWHDCLPLPFNLLYPFFLLNTLIWKVVENRGKVGSLFSDSNVADALNDEELKFLQRKQVEVFFDLDIGHSQDGSETTSEK